MRPPSYEEFMKRDAGPEAFSPEQPEPILFETCPTPGCGSKHLHPEYDSSGLLSGVTCGHGCVLTVRRNAFTSEIIYFQLISFNESNVGDPLSVKGIKFSPVGDIYTDWY